MSNGTPAPPLIGELLAQRRAEKKLSLQELANVSGVSKGMISQIENGQVNPTLAVVWKLATGLGIRLQDLLEGEPAREELSIAHLTEENCPTLASKKNGYRIQILSTIDMAEHVEMYLVRMAPNGNMDSKPHNAGTFETLTVVRGEVEVLLGNEPPRHVKTLETVRYRADVRHVIKGRGKREALIYLVVKFPLPDAG
ncbi:MAG: XRE family transcriptional regulator [Candidatus Sumerlaeia bacterium]|nr:XRE family transcriptional regulator [Candidatus Sumerlaeia bacterium]